MDQEKKLAEYRARKKREEQIQQYKEKVFDVFKWIKKTPSPAPENEELLVNEAEKTESEENPIPSTSRSDVLPSEPSYTTSKIRLEFYILFAILWLATYILFINLQFGTIYLIISAIFGIYLNTRTGPKDKNEISAYSVFNKNCESIDGTLKAEQFEREIRFGSMSVN